MVDFTTVVRQHYHGVAGYNVASRSARLRGDLKSSNVPQLSHGREHCHGVAGDNVASRSARVRGDSESNDDSPSKPRSGEMHEPRTQVRGIPSRCSAQSQRDDR